MSLIKEENNGEISGLDFKEKLILTNNLGEVEKRNIGDLVESCLTQRDISKDFLCTDRLAFHVTSFNPKTFAIEKKEVRGVSKKKVNSIYEVILDDYSKINTAESTKCYIFDNCRFKETQVKELEIGNYIAISNTIQTPLNYKNKLNLLDYNQKRKLNIKNLIENYPEKLDCIKQFLRLNRNSDWKYNQIMIESKERGLSITQLNQILSLLELDLETTNQYIRIITRGDDKLKPLIPICADLIYFTGIYVAEGHSTKRRIIISNSNKVIQDKCQKLAQKYDLGFSRVNKNDVNYYSIVFSNFFALFGRNAYTKNIPSLLYNIDENLKSILLRALFDGDGWVEKNSVCYLSASLELVSDIKNLLLYFDITSRIRIKLIKYVNNKKELEIKRYYVLTISGKDNLEHFLMKISFSLKYKERKLKATIYSSSRSILDLVPNCATYIQSLRNKYNVKQKDLSSHVGCSRPYISMLENNKRFPSKEIFNRILDFDKDNRNLSNLLNYNFRRIVSLRKIQPSMPFVYSLDVEDEQNFSAGLGNIFVRTT